MFSNRYTQICKGSNRVVVAINTDVALSIYVEGEDVIALVEFDVWILAHSMNIGWNVKSWVIVIGGGGMPILMKIYPVKGSKWRAMKKLINTRNAVPDSSDNLNPS